MPVTVAVHSIMSRLTQLHYGARNMAHRDPGEIATAIVYLASDDAFFVTGATFQIDGGATAGH